MKVSTLAPLALAAVVSAQRPEGTSICDYYTTALLKENNATNQQTLLTLVVNTAAIGNYTQPNVGIAVPGLLAPGTGDYEGVNLLPYFTGALASTNNGGSSGISVNFLDAGGAKPLMMNMPANNTNSAQYVLLTHLYSYFGYLLGCSEFSNTTMKYTGSTNMYETHKFMALNHSEVGWFIHNVGLSAASFGVADADVTAVGNALNNAFGYRCAPPASIPKSASPEPQSICIDADCPLAANATCANYSPVIKPTPVGTSPAMMGNSSMPHATGTGAVSTGTGVVPSGGPAMPTSSLEPYKGEAAGALPVLSAAGAAVVGLAAFML